MTANRQISLAHFTVMDVAPGDLVPLAADAGFDFVGLRIQPPGPGDSVVPVHGDTALQSLICAQMEETGVRIKDIEAFWLWPETDVPALRPLLETGAALGASHVLTVGNDPEHGRLADNLGAFSAMCGEVGLRPMLEFIPYSQVPSLEAALAMRETVGDMRIGVLVDALHLARSGGSPGDLACVEPGLLDYVHLCDAPALPRGETTADLRQEARSDRLYPGEGELPLGDLVGAAPDHAVLAIEAPSHSRDALPAQERARTAAGSLRALIGNG